MSNKTKSVVNGYILAGGKSSRMGMDKGLMMLNGKAVVQHAIEQLRPAVNEVVIVSDNPEYKRFGLEVTGDLIKNIGPAGGIFSALSHTDKNQNFIMSCDMPFINENGINYIIERSGNWQITLPVHDETVEPLFGTYSKNCLEEWKKLINLNLIKLQSMISHFNLLKIRVDQISFFEKNFFFNLNTMKEYENALKQK